jgi:hypothetical protein
VQEHPPAAGPVAAAPVGSAVAVGLAEVYTAFQLAKWSGLALICTFGFLAAGLAGSRAGVAILHAAAVGAIGGVLIAPEAVLH